MNYRSDIDGVRAIAVMSVILAHAGIAQVAGGFLGVDVFFVISGFLITTILTNDLEAGKYSLLTFYERRARRILPALLVVIAACVPFAVWLMLPDFLQNFGQSVVATLLFSNNILLALTSGYWELESAFKPLLHTWSLGVEEQFYVVFPLALAAAWRFGRTAQIATIIAAGAISLVLSEYGWRHWPDAAFYLPVTRAWELMAGCLTAYVARRERSSDNLLSLASLAAIVLPMVLFDEHTPSPSLWSAVPVLGTVGVILFSRPGTVAYRLLSPRPVVFVGLISYSAYLWHQPLFAFARIASLEPPPLALNLLLIAVTLALSVLSWRYVEVPFRDRKAMPLRRVAAILGTGTAVLVAIGLVFHFAQGFPRWSFPNIRDSGDVYIAYNERVQRYKVPQFADNGRRNVLLIGNSYGRDVGNILLESGTLRGRNLVYRTAYPACDETEAVTGRSADVYAAADLIVVGLQGHAPACVAGILREIGRRSAAPVVIFGTKQFGYNINPFGRMPLDRRSLAFGTMQQDWQVTNDALARSLPPSTYIDVARLLGPDGKRLRFFDDHGNPLTPDRMRLTRYGAAYVAQRLAEANPPAWQVVTSGQEPESVTAGEPLR